MSISGAFAFATSVAARTDSLHTATHQVCLQVWLAASLLADALAVAAQSLIARYLSSNDRQVSAPISAAADLCCSYFASMITSGLCWLDSFGIPASRTKQGCADILSSEECVHVDLIWQNLPAVFHYQEMLHMPQLALDFQLVAGLDVVQAFSLGLWHAQEYFCNTPGAMSGCEGSRRP